MKYTAVVCAPEKNMYECFKGEQLTSDRCRVELKQTDSGCEFHVESDDSVALRATLHSITKLFTVYEKTREL